MGLFGFVKKAVGKVAKFGLGQVTGGISNQVFDFIDHRKKKQHLKPIEEQLFNVRPTIRGGYRPKVSEGFGDFQYTRDTFGESPGERQERLRKTRLANLAKARARRRAKDLG